MHAEHLLSLCMPFRSTGAHAVCGIMLSCKNMVQLLLHSLQTQLQRLCDGSAYVDCAREVIQCI